MYWIYLILFILVVLVPDFIRGDFYFLSETRLEELLIFILGIAGFLIFVFKEHQLSFWESESARQKRRLNRATKDLTESYGYIGEVNRKMEILMQIGLGLADRSELSKEKEKEIYASIIAAAQSLMKARGACLRFVDIQTGKTQKEIIGEEKCKSLKNIDLMGLSSKVNIGMANGHLFASSHKEINNIKCFLVVGRYNETEANNSGNQEMLKFLASQALFLYAYSIHG